MSLTFLDIKDLLQVLLSLKMVSTEVLESGITKFEPSHEIMVLFVLRKLILQTRMRNHPVGLGA